MSELEKLIISLMHSDIFTDFMAKDSSYVEHILSNDHIILLKTGDKNEFFTFNLINYNGLSVHASCDKCQFSGILTLDSLNSQVEDCEHILPAISVISETISDSRSTKSKELIARINKEELLGWLTNYMKEHKPTEMNFKVSFAEKIFEKGHSKEIKSLVRKIINAYKSSLSSEKGRSSKGVNLFQILIENAMFSQQNGEYYLSWVISSSILDGLFNVAQDSGLNDEATKLYHDTLSVINALKKPDLPLPLRDEIRTFLTEMFLDSHFNLNSSKYHFLPILRYCIDNDEDFYHLVNQKIDQTQHIQTTFVLMIELLTMGKESSVALNYFQNQITKLHLIVWKRILDYLQDTKKEYLQNIFLNRITPTGEAEYDALLFRFKRKLLKSSDQNQAFELGLQEYSLTKDEDIIHKLIEISLQDDSGPHMEKLLELIDENLSQNEKYTAYIKLGKEEILFDTLMSEDDPIEIANYIAHFDKNKSKELSQRIIILTNEYLDSHAGPQARAYIKNLITSLNRANKSGIINKLLKDLKEEFSHRPTLASIL